MARAWCHLPYPCVPSGHPLDWSLSPVPLPDLQTARTRMTGNFDVDSVLLRGLTDDCQLNLMMLFGQVRCPRLVVCEALD